jgi:hypothetical protein
MRRLIAFVIASVPVMAQAPTVERKAPPPPPTAQQQIKAIAQEIKDLKMEVAELKFRIEMLTDTLRMASNTVGDIVPLELEYADLDPSGNGYGVIATDRGRFFISVEKIEPYLDGQRVHLTVGNPSLVVFNGCILTVTWNERMPKSKLSDLNASSTFEQRSAALQEQMGTMRAWEAKHRKQEFSLTTVLSPGRWTPIDVVLPNTTASQVGYLQVRLKVDRMSFPLPN